MKALGIRAGGCDGVFRFLVDAGDAGGAVHIPVGVAGVVLIRTGVVTLVVDVDFVVAIGPIADVVVDAFADLVAESDGICVAGGGVGGVGVLQHGVGPGRLLIVAALGIAAPDEVVLAVAHVVLLAIGHDAVHVADTLCVARAFVRRPLPGILRRERVEAAQRELLLEVGGIGAGRRVVDEQRVGEDVGHSGAEVEGVAFEADLDIRAGRDAGKADLDVAFAEFVDVGVGGGQGAGVVGGRGRGVADRSRAGNREIGDGELAIGGGDVVVELGADEVGAGGQVEGVLVVVEAGGDVEGGFRVGDDEVHFGARWRRWSRRTH